MKTSTIIFSILILGAIMTGMYFTSDELSEEYGVSYNNSYKDSFEKTENISAQIKESYSKIQNTWTANTIGAQIVTLVPQAIMLVIKLVILPFSIVGGIITALVGYLRLPEWTFTFIISIVSGAILFGLVALALRYKDV